MSENVGLTMGVALIGTLVSAVLYGITVTQTYLYFQRFPKDHYLIKTMVAVLWLLDTLHLALISHSIYFYLVLNYNRPSALASAVWSFNFEVSVNGVIGLIVECFFARRMLRLSGRSTVGKILTVIVCFLSLVHFGLGVFFTQRLFQLKFFSKFHELTWITKVGLGSAAACDLIIAVALCFYLYSSRTGYRKTDSLIVTLMLYTLNCGLLTGVCAALVVITFSIAPNMLFYMAFFWVLGKLYCNSCVAMLNSRQSLRGRLGYVAGSNLSDNTPSKFTLPRPFGATSLAYTTDTNFEILYARPPTPESAFTVRVDTITETSRDSYRHTANALQPTQDVIHLVIPEHPSEDVNTISPTSSTVPLIRDPWKAA